MHLTVPQEMFDIFGGEDPAQYAEEAARRWEDTEAFQESQHRTSTYMKDDWLQIKAEAAGIERRLLAVHQSGAAADSVEAMDAAEAHRRHIDRRYYASSPGMHHGLAEMYVGDERSAAHYDQQAAGFAAYVRAAITANAARQAAN